MGPAGRYSRCGFHWKVGTKMMVLKKFQQIVSTMTKYGEMKEH